MNLSLEKIIKYFPHFNKRAITELDFWRAAKKAKLVVRTMPLTVNGYYETKHGRHYILIDSRLSDTQFLHAALHEFCHFLFDIPTERDSSVLFQSHKKDDPRERFADAFALVGMTPISDLEKLSKEDLSDHLWLSNIVKDRIVVLTDYGI